MNASVSDITIIHNMANFKYFGSNWKDITTERIQKQKMYKVLVMKSKGVKLLDNFYILLGI